MDSNSWWYAGAAVVFLALGGRTPAQGQATPSKPAVAGITNFNRLDATVACAGATNASAVADLKQMGFRSIVNLRRATEEGADVEAERAAAEAAGIKYFHLPFTAPKSPDENVDGTVHDFLTVVSDTANQPVFIHCAGGGRASGMWMVKRVMIDGWTIDRAKAEAQITNPDPASASLKWAEEYSRTHAR
jgi:uncharacterized protein (TIGR01244 family)